MSVIRSRSGGLALLLGSLAAAALILVAILPTPRRGDPTPSGPARPDAVSPSATAARIEPTDVSRPTGSVTTVVPSALPSLLPGQPPPTAGLRDQLQCATPGQVNGQETGEYAVSQGAATPEAVFAHLIDIHYLPWLPLRGYRVDRLGRHWARLVYAPAGRVLALAVATDAFPAFDGDAWHMVGVMACDPGEFEPRDGVSTGDAAWTDALGVSVGTSVLEQRGDCYGGTLLRLDGRLYVRDPLGQAYDPGSLLGAYDSDASCRRTRRHPLSRRRPTPVRAARSGRRSTCATGRGSSGGRASEATRSRAPTATSGTARRDPRPPPAAPRRGARPPPPPRRRAPPAFVPRRGASGRRCRRRPSRASSRPAFRISGWWRNAGGVLAAQQPRRAGADRRSRRAGRGRG